MLVQKHKKVGQIVDLRERKDNTKIGFTDVGCKAMH